ncbi:MAG: hypothetical protein QXW98_06360 [Candidatus Caldarchaeum sp.]
MEGGGSQRYNEEKLIELFSDGLTVSEVIKAYEEEYGIRLPVREVVSLRLKLKDKIEERKAELYKEASEELSPAGLLRRIYSLISAVMRNKDKAVAGRRVADVATLFRLALDLWEKDQNLKKASEEEQQRFKEQLETMLRELEYHKELLENAERSGLLRFRHIELRQP